MDIEAALAARKAETQAAPPPQASNIDQMLEQRKAEVAAQNKPQPIDYSQKQEIGRLNADVPLMTQAKTAGALLLDSRPQAQIDILKENIPGIDSGVDDEGHAFVTYKGKEYYLNKPGVSEADVNKLIADAVQFFPASKIASIGKSVLSRLGIGALTYGGTSVGQDVAANALGSKQDIDPVKAGVSAIFGGAAEAVTPFVIQAAKRLISSRKLYEAGKGLTDRGKQMIKDLGFDPEAFNEAAAKEFSTLVNGKIDPKTAAGLSENRAFGISTTKGEATQNFGLLQKEDLARKGGYGERAQGQMQVLDEKKTGEILAAKDTVQSRLGNQNIANESEGAGIISEGLKTRAAAQNKVIDAAYKEAAQYDARLSMDSIKDFRTAVRKTINDGDTLIDKTLTPSTVRALKEIDGLTKGKNVTALTLKRMEATRRKLGHMIEAAPNSADKRNVTVIKNELDTFLDDAFDRALFEGDNQALAALKNARSARKRYGDLFQKGKDQIGEIEKIIKFDADESQTLSYLFGKGKLGGKDSANKVAVKVRDALGPDSPEWQTFKETAFIRLMKNTAKTHNGKTTFNGQAFVRNFDAALNDAPQLMKTVFGDALPYIKSFRNAVDRATFRPEGAVNTSGTGVAVSKMAQDLFKRVSLVMGLTGDLSSYVVLNGAATVAGKVGKNYAKGVKPALPSSSFASALAAATGVAGLRSQLPPQSANTRNEGGNK